MDTEARLAVAEEAAREGAEVALGAFRTGIAVDTKDHKTDVVTQADRDAQARASEHIHDAFPDEAVVGEESEALKVVPEDGPSWVIDPIDGTNNFVRDLRMWATSVAAVVDADPVAAANVMPAMGDVYTTDADGAYLNGDSITVSDHADPERCTVAPTLWWGFDRRDEFAAACRETVERFGDMRRFGSAQATLSFVAGGSLDGAFSNVKPRPWDTVAGVHLIRQAGGRVTDIHGDPWRHDSVGLVASNGAVHDEVLAAARAIEDVI